MDSRITINWKQAGTPTSGKSTFRNLSILAIWLSLLVITWNAIFAGQATQRNDNFIEINFPGETQEQAPSISQSDPSEAISLQAASGATVLFKSQNGFTRDEQPPEVSKVPRLVLFRNSKLTDTIERTLILSVQNLEIPPAGLNVALKLETQHEDPDQGSDKGKQIVVWKETKRIENPGGSPQLKGSASFEVEFKEFIEADGRLATTPTDYYRYEISFENGTQPTGATISQEYAFLIENQEIAPLNLEDGRASDTGPTELVLYYCDMFPFQKDGGNLSTRLSRGDVPEYVRTQILPALLAAIHQQQSWGLNWDQAWTNPRVEEDVDWLSIALVDGLSWFHGPAPVRGHSAISINVNGGNNKDYDSLLDGLLSTFHHELFHSFQRSINQAHGGEGDVSGKDKAWKFFTEGTAAVIPSIAQPEVQFNQGESPRAYLAKAAKFVGGGSFPGELNNSYAEMTPYRASIYWRFLYEQCGGLSGEQEDPAAGMALIQRVFEVLYGKEVVDTSTSDDLVGRLPQIMNRVLSSPEANKCPFSTYEQSLADFARAIYTLQLESGRCSSPGFPTGCGFYDPNNLYSNPSPTEIQFAGQEIILGIKDQRPTAGIGSSYGMDFVDIELQEGAKGKSLSIEFSGNPDGKAQFNLQVWKIKDFADGNGTESTSEAVSPVEMISASHPGGGFLYTISEIDPKIYNRLSLIITRVDQDEVLDPEGSYTIVLSSD